MRRAELRRHLARLAGPRLRQEVRARHLTAWPPVGTLRLGLVRRTRPLNDDVGFSRGRPVDRHYIESFLADHHGDVRGAGLEVLGDDYLRRFAAPGALTSIDVLDVDPANPMATLHADLGQTGSLPRAAFDCIVCTQTLHLVYELDVAIANLARALRPGGVLLATMPGTSRICREDGADYEDHWRITSASARRLFADGFDEVEVRAFGNVQAAAALLYGVAAEELELSDLDTRDPDFEVIVAVRAVCPG